MAEPVQVVGSTGSSRRAPRRIGIYDVIGELARGGMGIVYLACRAGEAGFQRLFAIKVLHTHLADDSSFVAMLHDEARIAARLHHPNVVPIVDLGAEDGLYYVVMEYVEGAALSMLLRASAAQRPARLVVPILIDILEGLHAAHTLTDDAGERLNLVHRDVSPQNILIGIDGNSRLTDFGIAKVTTRVTATVPGTRKGKLAYMAPEQLVNDGERIDQRADIFSAGAVLWTALTGLALFRASSDAATLHNILHKPVMAPSTVGLKPQGTFDEVCLRALERDPAQRYQSALEMADALRIIAIQERMLGSRSEVAEWVTGQFASEFAARREAIRQAAVRREVENTGVSLVALPEIAAPVSSATGPTTQSVSFEVVELPSASPQRRYVLVGALVALPLLLLGVGIGIWAATSTPGPTAGSEAALEAPRQAAASPPPASSPVAPAAVEKTSETDKLVPMPSSVPAESAEPAKRPVTAGPRPFVHRPVPPRPAPAPPVSRAPVQPAPASTPARTPAPAAEPTLERNPYLRQK
jgi:eukaryotic-like serine/threonine-protein kinase